MSASSRVTDNRRRRARAAPALATLFLALGDPVRADEPGRLGRINAAFVRHVASLGADHAVSAAVIREEAAAGAAAGEDFVLRGLALLYPEFRDALDGFDAGRSSAQAAFSALAQASDPFLSAAAAYFAARGLMEAGRFEEVLPLLEELAARPELGEHSPFAPHGLHLLAAAQTATLRFNDALTTLRRLREDYPDAAELVRVAARELQLEIERRERGNLDEVSVYMDYAAARLRVADNGPRVQQRQQQVIEMLDRLIDQAQQQENRQRQQQQAAPGRAPGNQPAEQSTAPPSGSAEPGQQHKAAKADPGQMWGKLPPAERERVLQSLRARFPSRYRQIVEQYYRSTAEQK